jgi:hypothetical protein
MKQLITRKTQKLISFLLWFLPSQGSVLFFPPVIVKQETPFLFCKAVCKY